jgi:G:T/U-mismatch repair DNA glycosylase
MLSEILTQNMNILFVGSTISEMSDELGFYYLGPNNTFWDLLEFARITPVSLVSSSERKVLMNAKKDGVLNDIYKQLFFERKETQLLKHGIGLTDLNRRRVVRNDDDPAAKPTTDDVQRFVRKVEKYRPKILAFATNVETFENAFKPNYPAATRQRGKQDFLIGNSEVWLLGSTSGRVKDTDALEQVFEDLAERLKGLTK